MDSDMGIDFGRGRGRAEWRWGKVEKMGTVRAYIIKINRLKKHSNPLLEFKMWA